MNLLSVQGLKKSYGTRVLFQDVTFTIGENDRIGLVGANGTGKTTLLRLLTSQDPPDEGTVSVSSACRTGVMEQDIERLRSMTLCEAALDIFGGLMAMEAQLEEVNTRLELGHGDQNGLIERQHSLRQRLEDGGALTYRSRCRAALLGLGFTEAQFSERVDVLSGGEQAKLKLARLLLTQPPLLLLDEPTNHLDIPAMEWLEDMLRAYAGAILVISHDRWLLDKITLRTFLLEDGQIRIAQAPYTEAAGRFAALDEHTARHAASIRREMKRLELIIAQQRRWNRERNIRMAESKQKVLDKLQKTLPTEKKTARAPALSFASQGQSSSDVLMARELSKSYGEKALFSGVSLHIRAQERLFILGPNGCGKSTLLKILGLTLAPDSGVVEPGPAIKMGYYDQTQAGLNLSNTVLQEMTGYEHSLTQLEIRSALAGMGFRGDDVHKPLSALSGGERARVCLLKLMLSPAHLLLLDEPTNHLDIASRQALEEALLGYDGTLIIVSHDRYFMRRLGGRTLLLTPDGLVDAPADASRLAQRAKPETAGPGEGNTYREKKAREAEQRKRAADLLRSEQAVAALEREMDALSQRMAAPELASDYAALGELAGQLDALSLQHDEQLALWLSLQE